jgi:hypothetical protein
MGKIFLRRLSNIISYAFYIDSTTTYPETVGHFKVGGLESYTVSYVSPC